MNIEPLRTKIDKTIQTRVGTIVLENPDRFPRGDSNLYCVASNGKIIWRAQKPDPDTLYSRVRLDEDGTTLSTYTIGGHACDVDLNTGKLISQATIK
jgi:outer membrane protein assembly factor BamB